MWQTKYPIPYFIHFPYSLTNQPTITYTAITSLFSITPSIQHCRRFSINPISFFSFLHNPAATKSHKQKKKKISHKRTHIYVQQMHIIIWETEKEKWLTEVPWGAGTIFVEFGRWVWFGLVWFGLKVWTWRDIGGTSFFLFVRAFVAASKVRG